MKKRTSQYLVPLALGALAAEVLFVAGCGKSEGQKKPQVPEADPPAVYMKDSAFRKALKEKATERSAALKTREQLLDELEKRVDAARAKMPGADDAAVKKELEKDPEWNSLIKRVKDANAAVNDNRQAATKLVAERLGARKQKPLK